MKGREKHLFCSRFMFKIKSNVNLSNRFGQFFDLEDLRMQFTNQRSTLDVMDFVTLQEERKLKMKWPLS